MRTAHEPRATAATAPVHRRIDWVARAMREERDAADRLLEQRSLVRLLLLPHTSVVAATEVVKT